MKIKIPYPQYLFLLYIPAKPSDKSYVGREGGNGHSMSCTFTAMNIKLTGGWWGGKCHLSMVRGM